VAADQARAGHIHLFSYCGVKRIDAGCARDQVRKPVPASELQRTKDSLKSNILLSLESPGARMNRLAKMELYTGEWQTFDDVIACIDAVTADDAQTLATDLFDDKAAFATIL